MKFEERLRAIRSEIEKTTRERARLEARLEELERRWKSIEEEAANLGVKPKKKEDLEAAIRRVLDEKRAAAEKKFREVEEALGLGAAAR